MQYKSTRQTQVFYMESAITVICKTVVCLIISNDIDDWSVVVEVIKISWSRWLTVMMITRTKLVCYLSLELVGERCVTPALPGAPTWGSHVGLGSTLNSQQLQRFLSGSTGEGKVVKVGGGEGETQLRVFRRQPSREGGDYVQAATFYSHTHCFFLVHIFISSSVAGGRVSNDLSLEMGGS